MNKPNIKKQFRDKLKEPNGWRIPNRNGINHYIATNYSRNGKAIKPEEKSIIYYKELINKYAHER
jgi:hypothetical protein